MYIPRDVILGVLAVVCKSTEEINLVADEGEAVAQPGTGRESSLGGLGLEAFPFPTAGLLETIHIY